MAEGNAMSELKPRIHDKTNGLDYARVGDYYIPTIKLPEDDDRPTSAQPSDLDGQTSHQYER